jgi:signal transduction histidine kinase/ActR/RegA family two-component response regulator
MAMRAAPLRHRLLLLAAVAILPLALMSGIALQALLDQQRRQTEQSALDLARALATAVDTELRLTVSALQSLALTEPLGSAGEVDLANAHESARRVLAARPEWRAILLATPAGVTLFSTGAPFGAPMPPIAEPESLAEVVRTGLPAVGPLSRGVRGNDGIPVRVPVVRDGKLRYVLSAIVRPDAILRVVNQQRVPDDWIVSVFDSHHARVARSRDHERFVGTPPSPTLQRLLGTMGSRSEAIGTTLTLEGIEVESALARVPSSNWVVALGVPSSVAGSAQRDSALAYGGGILLSLGLGSIAAWLLSGSIAAPIARLREAASALGRGEPVQAAHADLIEIEAVSNALVAASALRREGEAEREQLLDAERQARAAAERAQARLQQLVSAGALLSRSLEEETTLAAIASVIVPGIADICRIDLLDRDGHLQRKLTHHVDPAQGAAMLRFVGQSVSRAETPGSFSWAIATGRTFLADLDAELDANADPTFAAFVREFGIGSACVVPLVARGRTIGAMAALQAGSKRRLGPEDGALIGELAQRAALALDNVRLYGESRAALREAEVANRAKDEFLAMLGHELRNPLAPIVSSLEAMALRHGSGDGRERRVIERQVAHLSRMVDDLLDVSRISAGKIELRRERVDLREVVGRALELSEPALRARDALPELTLPERPVWVSGDPVRLAQVLCNLITNAAKFSAPEQRIAIGLEATAATAFLRVSDEGVGIPASLLPHVFERFVQGEQALQRASGGLGLGLAIAKNLVELHGGTIEVASAGAGRGAVFTIALPSIGEPEAAAKPVPAAAPPAPLRRSRLLIVDDNDDAAQSLALVLGLEGHEVRTAGDAETALDLLADFVPEAAILDIGLPMMNGYELAAALRADPRTRSIVLIALTGYGRDPDRRRALEAGFDEHLVKPVEFDRLLGRLAALLARDAALAG